MCQLFVRTSAGHQSIIIIIVVLGEHIEVGAQTLQVAEVEVERDERRLLALILNLVHAQVHKGRQWVDLINRLLLLLILLLLLQQLLLLLLLQQQQLLLLLLLLLLQLELLLQKHLLLNLLLL